MDFTIIGIGGAILVGLLVEGVKRVFPTVAEDSRRVIALALGLGVLLAVLAHLAEVVPGFETWLSVVFAGLLAGFVAMGMYDAQKAARG
jgi:hypothetical protein